MDERTNCTPVVFGEKERQVIDDEFHDFSLPQCFFFCAAGSLPLNEVFKTRLESFWSQCWLKPPFRQLRNCRCELGFSVFHFNKRINPI